MRMLKRVLSITMVVCMLCVVFAGCNDSSSGSSDTQEIYFLNFKPEVSDVYKTIATKYELETGVKVKVITAASGTYETKLTSEMAKSNPPTIFQINGPVGYENWKDYCADISDSKLYEYLTDKSLAVTSGDGVYGIPYAIEGYGIIYNNAIMDKYFASSKKTSSISSMDEINNFAKLKEVVEDMTKIKDELEIDGVFASTSLKSGEDWRWQTHLVNVPFYYEFGKSDTGTAATDAATIEFSYSDNYKNIFDLYINNSCTEKGKLGSKSVEDSMSEFALGKVAMVQNGNWAWGQISGTDGNVVGSEDIKYLPIYTGADGEESQGLCVGTENFFAINSKVDEATQKASLDFLDWLFSSDDGKDTVIYDLGFTAPFSTFNDDEKPSDPLATEILNWAAKDGITSVEWTFVGFPSQDWKNQLGSDLLLYAQGQKEWDKLVSDTIAKWASERG